MDIECLAKTECLANGWQFEDVFRYQYRITSADQKRPLLSDAWATVIFSGLRIEHCPSLPITCVTDKAGETIAVVLGIGITTAGTCLGATATVDGDGQALERWIEALSGRFVVVAAVGSERRLYLDPAGNLSAVFNAGAGIVASSVPLAVSGPLLPHAEIDADMVLQGTSRLLFGETSDQRITRARPNHYVTIGDFSSVRHWPRDDTAFADLDQDRRDLFSEINERLAHNIAALVDRFNCALPVTAGMDSRIILAAAYPLLDRIREFYCYHLNRATQVDAVGAVRLAEQLAIPMRIISRRSPWVQNSLPPSFEDEEYQRMVLRTGWCFKMRRDWARFVALTPRVDVTLRGTGLEMTRANKWTDANVKQPCDAKNGLRALAGLRADKKRDAKAEKRYQHLLAEYQNWMDTLPEPAHARLYDLAHVELMLPSGPVLEYSTYVDHFTVNPFNDRRLYQVTAGIAPRARMRGSLVRKIIAASNPSLLNVPFHRQLAGDLLSRAETDR